MRTSTLKIRIPGVQEGSNRRWIALALWLLFFVLTCYCTLGCDFLAKPIQWMYNTIKPWEYYPFWIIALGSVVAAICIYPPKISRMNATIIAVVCVIWMTLEAIRVFTVPRAEVAYTLTNPMDRVGTTTVVYGESLADQLMDFSDEILWVLLLFSIFTMSKPLIGKLGMKVCLWTAILVCFVSIFYTYSPSQIGAYDAVIDFFTGKSSAFPDIAGFFPEKNSFAFCIFIGLLSTMILNAEHPRAWLYVPIMLYFGATIMLSGCKTLMVILIVFTPIYMIWRVAITYRDHPIRNSITLAALIILIVVAIALLETRGNVANNLISHIKNALDSLINRGGATMSSRYTIWKSAMTVYSYSPFRMIFGWGYRAGENLSMLFQAQWATDIQRSTHSGMLDILLRWGAIGAVGFISMLALATHKYLELSRSGRTDLAVELAIVMALLIIYSVDESKMPFYRDTTSIILLVICVCPAMAFNDGGHYIQEVLI